MVCKLLNLHAYFLWFKDDEIMQNLKLLDYTKKRLNGMYFIVYAIKYKNFHRVTYSMKTLGVYWLQASFDYNY